MKDSRYRIAFYTHDTFGLGHVRRCLHMIRELSLRYPDAALLLVTGTPALQYFKNLPPNVDIIKIPTVVKTGVKESAPPHLPLDIKEMTSIRSRIIRESILAFDPDIFVVDNFPLGARSELRSILNDLKSRKTKTVLGLRDILDDEDVIRKDWTKRGTYQVLEELYDKILIYGEQEIYDPIQAYGLSPSIARKCHFCGYLTATDTVPDQKDVIRREYGVKGPLIIATGGGGGDAYPLLSTFIQSMETLEHVTAIIFTGPMMGEEDSQKLHELAQMRNNIIIRDFVPDLRPYLKAADLVVSMCGYNSASELVQHRVRAVVVPRTWRFGEHVIRDQVKDELEQRLRAEVLSKSPLIEMLMPEELTSESLKAKMVQMMEVCSQEVSPLTTTGLQSAVDELCEILNNDEVLCPTIV